LYDGARAALFPLNRTQDLASPLAQFLIAPFIGGGTVTGAQLDEALSLFDQQANFLDTCMESTC
jgi:hypothetical protein